MRSEKSLKNLVFGLLGFAITTLLGLLIPRLFILSFGSELNGLINSVKQIFAYFILLEAGIGGAALQALYGPMAKDDKKEISSILSATSSFYRKTGFFYLASVLVLAVVYPLVIQSSIPRYIIICIILFQGEAGVIKYFVTSKLQLLLKVDGQTYILTNIATVFSIFSNLARITLLYLGANVLWVQGVFCVIDVCQVIIIVLYTRKHYPWLNLKEKPNFQAVSQKKDVLVHQLSALVFNNTDTLILTFFCGLKSVSVYTLYAMLFGVVANISSYISSSVNFAMGQLFHSDRQKYERIQNTYETYYLSIIFSFFTIAFIFILPFIKLYTAGITDVEYVDKKLAVLFVLFQLLNYGRSTSNNIIEYAGHFRQTKWRSIIEATLNLSVSLICVNKFGVYGVLIGTIIALLYRSNDIILYANKKIMKRSPFPTYIRWIRNSILLVICSLIADWSLPQSYNGYYSLILTAIFTGIIVLAAFLVINTLLEKTARETMKNYLILLIKKEKNK